MACEERRAVIQDTHTPIATAYRRPERLTAPAAVRVGMDVFKSLFGNGDGRPPAPEMATPDDVEEYNIKFAKAHGLEADTNGGPADPNTSYYAKAADDALGEGVTSRAEFPWLFDPQRGVRWDFDPVQLRNLAQENTWVGMLVQSITKEVAETSWTITEAGGRAETQKRLNTHPEQRDPLAKADGDGVPELPDETARRIHDLLARPSPDTTWQDLVEMWLGDLLEVGSLTGVKAFPDRAYSGEDLVVDPSTIEPRAIQASAPEVWTKDYQGKTGLLDAFWQFEQHKTPGGGQTRASAVGRGGTTPTRFEPAEVVWSDMTPRSNRRYGMPPTLLVQDFLKSLDLAITQEQQYLSRGSIPSGAWVFEEWDREEVKEWKTENEENVKGKPHKSLMFAGRGGDVRFEAMSMNFSELEFTERMKWYARVVASVFQVPTAVVGIEPERVNYNTFKGERENFESNTLGPYLQKLERVANHGVIQPHWGHDYRFEFLPGMSEPTRKMISDRVRAEFNAGIRTRNETRRELGLSEVGDELDGFQDEVVDDTSPEDAGDALGDLVANQIDKSEDDGPLRNTDAWHQFDVQPSDVQRLQDELAADVSALFEDVLADDELMAIIGRLAGDETDKSLTQLTQRLRELLTDNDVAARIREALQEDTADIAAETVRETLAEASDAPAESEVDIEAIRGQLADRSVAFADRFADELAEDIRETVGDGWAEGKGTREIAADIAEQADINEGWTGAERIARQELHIATGQARSEVAGELDKIEVWATSGDDRVRDAHAAMDGAWKRAGEAWRVEYPDRGVQTEKTPGDSEPGIGCRCTTLLRDRESVDADDHAGV